MSETDESIQFNLLTEPLIRVRSPGLGVQIRTLPGVLEELSNGDGVEGFEALQPHQWHTWHAFLVQLGAMATLEHGLPAPSTEGEWREAIRALTPEHPEDEPWCLVVSRLDQPAFLQPPVPEGSLDQFKGPYYQPDASSLDLLVTATDHDVKMARQVNPQPDHWVFALTAFQTFSGFSGKNNYGVIRMNGGYGTRPLVGLAHERSWTGLFRRDLAVLLDHHMPAARQKGLAGPGHRLLWLPPWDGESSVSWADCDPYCIEIARRVRLTLAATGISAWQRSTKKPRLSPKSDVLKGTVADPWIPVTSDGEAANVSSTGWHYDRVRRILLQDGYHWAPAQVPRDDDPDSLWFYAAALARGQGKTGGFHERWIPIPARARRWLSQSDGRKTLAEIASERVKKAGEARKVLHRAFVILLKSAPESIDFRHDGDRRWLSRYDRCIDAVFFDQLWEDSASDREESRRRWEVTLREVIEERLWPEARDEIPVADSRRERAEARAWMVLRGGLKKTLPKAFEQEVTHART